jgi:16S rRNA (guanine527-N7)-methyltransferase
MDNPDRSSFVEALAASTAALDVNLTTGQQERMWRHYLLVVETNRRFNLTRVTSPVDAAVKHYADALTLLTTGWALPATPLRVLDVGTGAGFPAVPLAIVCTAWEVTAIDGTGKKARFVEQVATDLALGNLSARHARAADLARTGEALFDLVLLRAVTQTASGIDEAHPLVSPGGSIVFFKTPAMATEEWDAGNQRAVTRGFSQPQTHDVLLSGSGEPLSRRLIRYIRG